MRPSETSSPEDLGPNQADPRSLEASGYELIDFGGGRKWERFGEWVVERPCPQSAGATRVPSRGIQSHYQFVRGRRPAPWSGINPQGATGTVVLPPIRFTLRLTASGQVGVFPEQSPNWQWIVSKWIRRRIECRVLNLFAYTGGSTIAAALAGAYVTHVDAARNVIAWARSNCQLNQLDPKQIRWIVDDARKFVDRELRRGRTYDAIILDPPTYGHGSTHRTWCLDRDLDPLLRACARLLSSTPEFLLLTCHSPGFDQHRLIDVASRSLGANRAGQLCSAPLELEARSGKRLDCGAMVRWTYQATSISHGKPNDDSTE